MNWRQPALHSNPDKGVVKPGRQLDLQGWMRPDGIWILGFLPTISFFHLARAPRRLDNRGVTRINRPGAQLVANPAANQCRCSFPQGQPICLSVCLNCLDGIPVFEVPDDFPTITTERVRELLDEE